MSTDVQEEVKGKYHWVIPTIEILTVIGIFVYWALCIFGIVSIGASAGNSAAGALSVVGASLAIWTSLFAVIKFCSILLIVLTVLCFVPMFKSKTNTRWAIFNIIIIVCSLIF